MKHPMIRKICRFSMPFHANPMGNPRPGTNSEPDLVLMKPVGSVAGFFSKERVMRKDGLP